jgi:hypothetical protein
MFGMLADDGGEKKGENDENENDRWPWPQAKLQKMM